MTYYERNRANMKTGDILLFSGNGLISKGIQVITGSPWSHVGVVFVDERYDYVCCYESTTLSTLPDLTTGAKVKGVQMVPLSQRIASYDGDLIAWRPVEAERTEDAVRAALDVRKEFAGRPYEENQLELLRSALDKFTLKQNQPDASSVFCSELVAILWQRMGWMGDISPNEVTPADFAGGDLPLNVEVGPLVMLKDTYYWA